MRDLGCETEKAWREGWGYPRPGTDSRPESLVSGLLGPKLSPRHRLGNGFILQGGGGLVSWGYKLAWDGGWPLTRG